MCAWIKQSCGRTLQDHHEIPHVCVDKTLRQGCRILLPPLRLTCIDKTGKTLALTLVECLTINGLWSGGSVSFTPYYTHVDKKGVANFYSVNWQGCETNSHP